ncbi:MAG TPA: hypothetical protein VJW76_08290 [Verrucomicrobiae bacterium]|nr:hypothetical protein [Verrucomicrobiae bacterium]
MNSLERERWWAGLLLSGLIVLLAFAAFSLGGSMPALPVPGRNAAPPRTSVPVGSIDALFAPATLGQLAPPAKLQSPFYTAYYQPPAPKPPTTRKVDMTYQGFIETAEGQQRAFIKTGDTLFVGPVGSKVLADLVVVEIAPRRLTLTNSAARTNVLEFNARQELEVPAQ